MALVQSRAGLRDEIETLRNLKVISDKGNFYGVASMGVMTQKAYTSLV